MANSKQFLFSRFDVHRLNLVVRRPTENALEICERAEKFKKLFMLYLLSVCVCEHAGVEAVWECECECP